MFKKIKDKIFQFLLFFRLIDDSSKVSLTNIAVYIMLYRWALVKEMSYLDVIALSLVLLNYFGKKLLPLIFKGKIENGSYEALEQTIKEVQDKVGSLSVTLGFNKNGRV